MGQGRQLIEDAILSENVLGVSDDSSGLYREVFDGNPVAINGVCP